MTEHSIPSIGRVRSAYESRDEAPKQGSEARAESIIELDPELAPGLTGMKPGKWLWVIYLFDRSNKYSLMVHPRGNPENPLTGVFNTRSPNRPASLALSLVQVVSVDGATLKVKGLEALDDSPVLDLKPYIGRADAPREE